MPAKKRKDFAKTGPAAASMPVQWMKPEFTFVGNISNLTGHFAMHDMGSVRRIERKITRERFVDEYLTDIAGIFRLNDGQKGLLKVMISGKKYSGDFRYDEAVCVALAEEAGLQVATTEQYFRSLVSAKGLVKKIKRSLYRLNEEYLFHFNEIAKADFLGVHMSYVFTDQGTILTTKPGKITEEMINELIEIHRLQKAREKQMQEMAPNSTKSE
jgi:hypothetical protein